MNALSLKRKSYHQYGIRYLQQSELPKAERILVRGFEQCGPHVGLLSDLCSVFYLQQKTQDFNYYFDLLNSEIQEQRDILSFESYFHSCIYVAKFHEEKGEVAKALEIYDKLRKESDGKPTQIWALTQLLRLKSFLGLKKDLPALYQEVLFHNSSSDSIHIETEHSLMLAEIILFGAQQAYHRISKNLESADLNFLLFDYLEMVLQTGANPSTELQSIVSETKTFSYFEKSLLDLMNRKSTDDLILNGAKELSFTNYLRLAYLLMQSNTNDSNRREIQEKLSFLIQTLSTPSKQLLLHKFNLITESSEDPVLLDYKQQRLIYRNQTSIIQKNQLMLELLKMMSETGSKPTDFIILRLYDEDFNESSFQKLRQLCLRINKKIASELGLVGFLKLGKAELCIRHQVTLLNH